ncbi:DUF2255 family protein [Frondihabitans cladoniiphilus]|uniref:DUF2255 family protein n=1 Tax=Frondihabitans cladoniiphilus TaxID=715785 RepID=A0ABP8W887_9MICO
MATWPAEQFQAITRHREIQIQPFGGSDAPVSSTTTWMVAVDGALYARAYRGQGSRWYQRALSRGLGRISAGEQRYDVSFIRMDQSLNKEIDSAYRKKYRFRLHLRTTLSATMQAATVRIDPR